MTELQKLDCTIRDIHSMEICNTDTLEILFDKYTLILNKYGIDKNDSSRRIPIYHLAEALRQKVIKQF